MNSANTTPGDWFGQPRGLTVLFSTEMWEKFSFYGMRALLVYYMTKELGFAQNKASMIYGLYTALVYLSPIFGGIISDRWLGRRFAVMSGASIMAVGHFLMVVPHLFYPALGTIAVGNGLYLPNLASQIDRLYASDDPRRGSAYNIYYVGVNLGALIAPLVCGTLGEFLGWHFGFGAAGAGMCFGLIVYLAGSRWLPADIKSSSSLKLQEPAEPMTKGAVALLIVVLLGVIAFRAAYEQIGNTIALWADGDVNRSVGGFQLPGSWFQALNPLLVFLFTPWLVRRWTTAAKQGREPSPMRKMAYGCLGLMAAYLTLTVASALGARTNTHPHWLWLVGFIVVLTSAELFILPVGLGLFARLSPDRHRATTIAAWFLAAFFGNLLAGALGGLWSTLSHQLFLA